MLDEVSKTLLDVLNTSSVAPDSSWAEIASLASDGNPQNKKVNVFLYAVEEHPHMRNQPLVRVGDRFHRPPMSLKLHYLITYVGAQADTEAHLALVLRTFH